ncbi:MAG: elongation factor P maturation arginine rhamnosyltransferase EarP [Gammaproteobacteria bacterium]|nr:elongation factor P maturation arginine rhamnosyltransferase EarP [Gammaproteobacteria bacterium]
MRFTWDIFCCVIDNFGDIGVTWRLARQLAAEFDQEVRLWVDDLQAFCRLCPEANTEMSVQTVQGVALHHWQQEWQPVPAADIVIEAFACQLPPAYIESMAQRSSPPLWLNLEYLSAEDWVGGCHGLPSPQAGGLLKFFFFPGFTSQTGGLLRETGLIEQRLSFQQDRTLRLSFLQRIGVTLQSNTRLISLFAYENPGLASWLEALATGEQATLLLVPKGRIVADLQAWLGLDQLVAGDVHTCGLLTVQIIPFLSQQDYDRLLWSCDLNIVRGEDSFVRAQWAGRPFLWHIYAQQENAHMHKLEAFLKLYTEGLTPAAKNALQTQWRTWNMGEENKKNWQILLDNLPELTIHAENWCQQLAKQTNISTALIQSHLNWLKCANINTIHPSSSGH